MTARLLESQMERLGSTTHLRDPFGTDHDSPFDLPAVARGGSAPNQIVDPAGGAQRATRLQYM